MGFSHEIQKSTKQKSSMTSLSVQFFVGSPVVILSMLVCSIALSGDVSEYESNYFNVDDQNKIVTQLNSIVVITDVSKSIYKEYIELELSRLFFNLHFIKDVKEDVVTSMEKTVSKSQIENFINSYISDQLGDKNKRKVYSSLKAVDLIINLILKDNQMEIRLLNSRGERIAHYKQKFKKDENNTKKISIEKLDTKVIDLFNEFMDRYFYKTIILLKPDQVYGNIFINDKIHNQKWEGEKQVIINNIPRYENITISIISEDSISNNIQIKGDTFKLNGSNEKRDQNNKMYQSTPSQPPRFKAKGSLIKFNLSNFNKIPVISNNVNIIIFNFRSRTTFKYSLNKNYTTNELIVPSKNIGSYFYTIKVDERMKTFPRFINLIDSVEYKIKFGDIETVNQEVNNKSKTFGRSLSTILPGMGHVYVDKPKLKYLFIASLYCYIVYKSVDEYNNFISNRDEYSYWQNEYNNLDDSEPGEKYLEYETMARSYYNKSKKSRENYYKYISGLVLANIGSNIHLELRMNWDL